MVSRSSPAFSSKICIGNIRDHIAAVTLFTLDGWYRSRWVTPGGADHAYGFGGQACRMALVEYTTRGRSADAPTARALYFPIPRGLPRETGGSASTISLSRPAQASLALRPAGSLNRPRRPLSRGFETASYPTAPPVSYQINRQLSGWILPPLVFRAFGAHCRLVATSRPPVVRNRLPLYLRKQTFSWPSLTSGCDPTQTFVG